jgi:hypothetical protein
MPVLPACDGVKELDPAMHLIKRYKQLSAVERSLFFRALAAVAVLRIGLWMLPFRVVRNLVEQFRRSPGRRFDLDRRNIRQVAWAVEAASRRIPGTTCLPQGMATHLLLGRLGQRSQLRLGVTHKPGGRLEAHAWVEVNGRVVSGGAVSGFEEFVPLQQQASQGT